MSARAVSRLYMVLELLLLSDYLATVRELAVLDSAITSRLLRPAFLSVLSSVPFGRRMHLLQELMLSNSSRKQVDRRGHSMGSQELLWLSRRRCQIVDLICREDAGVLEVEAAVRASRKVRSLYLNGWYNLRGSTIAAIAACCSALTTISLSQTDIWDSNVLTLAEGCPLLRKVSFRECSFITDDAMQYLADHCPLLRCVSIDQTEVTDLGVVELARRCRLLEVLHAYECCGVTDASLRALAQGCPALKGLNVEHTQVSLAGLLLIPAACRQLEYVGTTLALSPQLCSALVRCECRLTCLFVDDTDVEAMLGLVEACARSLVEIHVTSAAPSAVTRALDRCPLLQELYVREPLADLADLAEDLADWRPTLAHAVARCGTSLRCLSMRSCILDDASFLHVVDSCPRLRYLAVDCSHVSEHLIRDCALCMPWLTIVSPLLDTFEDDECYSYYGYHCEDEDTARRKCLNLPSDSHHSLALLCATYASATFHQLR